MVCAISTTMFLNYDAEKSLQELFLHGINKADIHYDNIILHLANREPSLVVEAFRKSLDKAMEIDISVESIHMPYGSIVNNILYEKGLSSLLDFTYSIAVHALDKGVKALVLHPIYSRKLSGEEHSTINVLFLTQLCSKLEKEGYTPIIAVENLSEGYWSNLEELYRLIVRLNTTGCNNIGLCFDIGHANIASSSLCRALVSAEPFIKVIHIHDNNGKSDQHLMPGCGSIDWDKVSEHVKAITSSIILVSEVQCMDKHSICISRLRLTLGVMKTLFPLHCRISWNAVH